MVTSAGKALGKQQPAAPLDILVSFFKIPGIPGVRHLGIREKQADLSLRGFIRKAPEKTPEAAQMTVIGMTALPPCVAAS